MLRDENRNCIIVHGCPLDSEKAMDPERRTYNKHWMPWVQKELIAQGIPTEIPLMPNPWAPEYESYKKEFEKYHVDEQTILIGHSCGCAFLVRWLGETRRSIAKLILVAPWKILDENNEGRKKFYDYPIDESITSRVGEIVIFTSNDEEDDGKNSVKIFHDALGGELVELQNHGHYCLDDMGTEEFPEVVQIIFE